jgi:hypothetical protein
MEQQQWLQQLGILAKLSSGTVTKRATAKLTEIALRK